MKYLSGFELAKRWNMDTVFLTRFLNKPDVKINGYESDGTISTGQTIFIVRHGSRRREFDSFIGRREEPLETRWNGKTVFRKETIEDIYFLIKEIEAFEAANPDLIKPGPEPAAKETEPNELDPNVSHRHKEDYDAKEQCIEAARNLRLKHPEMTIADACFNDMVCKAAIKSDGGMYTEKTIRNWINTLWPDAARKPGRPKKQ